MRNAASLAAIALCVLAAPALAQSIDRRYAEEPTGGLSLHATPLAGEHDARAVTMNPGGLALLRGPEIALALELADADVSTSAGPGFGAYIGTSGGGGILPRYGFGLGFEWLRPPRSQLTPDPGEPFRFTMSFATGFGANGGFGLAWHHFSADGALSGEDTFDLGYSARFGSHLAIGATLRDINTKPIGGAPIQRRYELEALTRPLATDALEVALGGRIGETRGDLDGWARIAARVARGVYVIGAFETRQLYALEDSPMGLREVDTRDMRATLGLELSLGRLGVTALGTGIRDDAGKTSALGGSFVVRSSLQGPPSVLGRSDHIERIELAGEISVRELTSLVVRLRAIARDKSAKALVVMFDGASGGWATLQELREEILGVKRAGKKVFAYMVSGTGRDYFIASAADKIYIDPAGGLRIVGIAGTSLFFRGAFDLVGVAPQFEKIAEYKTAPEQFTETKPSETNTKMATELFDSLWDQWLSAVADGRKLPKDELARLVDGGPYTAGELANDKKLVDGIGSPEKISEMIVSELGAAYPVMSISPDRPDRWQRPGVAVIYVNGDITDGKSQTVPLIGRDIAGGETLVAAVTAARNDPRIGAIVLRIDSPGGSALASELVSREVFATRGVKPIICSLSDYAASGGYFIAAGCDMIFAEPMTITGSIGVFYGKFDVSGLLAKVGVTTSTQKRGKRSDLESFFRPYTEDERAMLKGKLQYMYSRFIGAVADGRKITKEQVDAVGRGHVYTGMMAQPIKLVDRFGGLGDALDEAKRRMGLSPAARVTLVELPKVPSSMFGLIGDLLGVKADAKPTLDLSDLPLFQQLLRGVPASVLVAPHEAQARLPYEIQFD